MEINQKEEDRPVEKFFSVNDLIRDCLKAGETMSRTNSNRSLLIMSAAALSQLRDRLSVYEPPDVIEDSNTIHNGPRLVS